MGIKKLPHDLSSRIAAGEVVDRPASAIKELLENSLDAGARSLRIYLEQGGKSSFSIEDDGARISFSELPLAVERYATSKIESLDDLDRIGTLGYRGEALASIAAVSRLEIRTRAAETDEGGMIRVEGGLITVHVPIPAVLGTRIQVDDLFYNLPARRKFLKTASAELRHVTAVVRDYALMHPQKRFQVFSDGKLILDLGDTKSTEDVLTALWGADAPFQCGEWQREGVRLRAWWSFLPGSRRMNTTIFVNARRVQDGTVRAALNATEGCLFGDWLLLIDLPPEEVDVNIHPTKQEVRFRYSGRIFSVVHHGAKELLLKRAGIAPRPMADPWDVERPPLERSQDYPPLASMLRTDFSRVSAPVVSPSGGATLWEVIPPAAAAEKEAVGSTRRFIAQTPQGYLIFMDADGLLAMDPHAAHERILFEEICRSFADGIPSQQLAFPQELPAAIAPEAMSYQEELARMGFRLERGEGDSSFRLMTVPVLRGGAHLSPLELLRSTLRGLGDEADPLKRDREIWWRWARTACRDAVKLGQEFTAHGAESLLEKLEGCEQGYSCPHGRPTVIALSDSRLHHWFERS